MAYCLLQHLQRLIARTGHLWHRAMAFLHTQSTSQFQYVVPTCLVRRTCHHAAVPESQLLHYEDVIAAELDVCSTVLLVARTLLATAAQGGAIYVSRIPLPVSQRCDHGT